MKTKITSRYVGDFSDFDNTDFDITLLGEGNQEDGMKTYAVMCFYYRENWNPEDTVIINANDEDEAIAMADDKFPRGYLDILRAWETDEVDYLVEQGATDMRI